MEMTDMIFKVLAGTATAAEKKAVEVWIAGSAENRQEYEDLRMLWMISRRAVPDDRGGGSSESSEGFRRIREAVGVRRQKRQRRVGRIAGVVFVCVAAVLLTAIYMMRDSQLPLLEFQDASLQSVLRVLEHEYGIEVRAEDEALLACPVTVIFYRVDQPDEVIRSVSDAVKAHVVTTAPGKYRLTGQGC